MIWSFLNTGITTCNFWKGCQPETYNKSGTRTSSKEKDGTTTTYGSDGETPTSKTYPDGGKINYDSNGNPTSYTSPNGTTTPLDGPPGC